MCKIITYISNIILMQYSSLGLSNLFNRTNFELWLVWLTLVFQIPWVCQSDFEVFLHSLIIPILGYLKVIAWSHGVQDIEVRLYLGILIFVVLQRHPDRSSDHHGWLGHLRGSLPSHKVRVGHRKTGRKSHLFIPWHGLWVVITIYEIFCFLLKSEHLIFSNLRKKLK